MLSFSDLCIVNKSAKFDNYVAQLFFYFHTIICTYVVYNPAAGTIWSRWKAVSFSSFFILKQLIKSYLWRGINLGHVRHGLLLSRRHRNNLKDFDRVGR